MKLRKFEIFQSIIIVVLISTIFIVIDADFLKKGASKLINNAKTIFLTDINLQQINLKINNSDLIKLNDQNNFFINQNYGVLDKNFNSSIKAQITIDDRLIKGRLKLNGQTNSHREIFSFSFKSKINVFEDNSNYDYSFRTIKERSIYDHLVSKLFKEKGLLATQIKYYELKLNGKNLGIYAVQDNINNNFLEDNGYRGGPVIALRNYHFESQYFTTNIIEKEKYTDGYLEDVNDDTKNLEISDYAIEKLKKFIYENRDINELFDINYWAKYFALCEIYLCYDLDTQDIRFYFNPITEKFIPILDDPHSNLSGQMSTFSDSFFYKRGGYLSYFEHHHYFILNSFFTNRSFLKEYNLQLSKLINNKTIPDSPYINRINTSENIFNPDFYLNRINFLNTKLKNEKILFSSLDISEPNSHYLYIDLIDPNPIELIKLTYDNKTIYKFNNEIVDINMMEPEISKKFVIKNLISDVKIKDYSKIKLHFKKLGINSNFDRRINSLISNSKVINRANAIDDNFLKFDQINRKIICPSIIELDGDYTLEKSFELDCSKTREIILKGDTTITLFNSLNLGGNNHVTKLYPNNHSLNISLYNTEKPSMFKNLEIIGLIKNNLDNFKTGIFTFYNSDILIENFTSKKSNSEDLINCIRSNIKINNLLIQDSSSDSIDFDFCNVDLYDLKIINPSGDGLDFSYSSGNMKNIFVSGAIDKGISIGENSVIQLEDVLLKENSIGIAIKDGSYLRGEFANFINNKSDILSYNKKDGYNKTATYIKHINSNKDLRIFNEKNHILEINNSYIDNNNFDFEIFK